MRRRKGGKEKLSITCRLLRKARHHGSVNVDTWKTITGDTKVGLDRHREV